MSSIVSSQTKIGFLLPNLCSIPQEWQGWEEDCNVAMSYQLSVRKERHYQAAGALFTSSLPSSSFVYGGCLLDNGACREDVPWIRPRQQGATRRIFILACPCDTRRVARPCEVAITVWSSLAYILSAIIFVAPAQHNLDLFWGKHLWFIGWFCH